MLLVQFCTRDRCPRSQCCVLSVLCLKPPAQFTPSLPSNKAASYTWARIQVSARGHSEASSDGMRDALAAVAAGALPAALEAALRGQAAIIAAAGSGGFGDALELHGVQVKLQAAEAAITTIRGLQRLPAGSAAAAQSEVRAARCRATRLCMNHDSIGCFSS